MILKTVFLCIAGSCMNILIKGYKNNYFAGTEDTILCRFIYPVSQLQ